MFCVHMCVENTSTMFTLLHPLHLPSSSQKTFPLPFLVVLGVEFKGLVLAGQVLNT
jgi:hypothetical protein